MLATQAVQCGNFTIFLQLLDKGLDPCYKNAGAPLLFVSTTGQLLHKVFRLPSASPSLFFFSFLCYYAHFITFFNSDYLFCHADFTINKILPVSFGGTTCSLYLLGTLWSELAEVEVKESSYFFLVYLYKFCKQEAKNMKIKRVCTFEIKYV